MRPVPVMRKVPHRTCVTRRQDSVNVGRASLVDSVTSALTGLPSIMENADVRILFQCFRYNHNLCESLKNDLLMNYFACRHENIEKFTQLWGAYHKYEEENMFHEIFNYNTAPVLQTKPYT